MAAYTTIDDPSLYFQVKLYTGTGSENAITLDGDTDMQPDLVWIKCRSNAENHVVHDAVRAATNVMHSDTTDAEYAVAQGLKSFGSDGFTLGTSNFVNQSSRTFVAWCWKAGTAFSNDASATSIGTIDSSGSTNQSAGFSIVSWTGTGSAGTVAHNLGSVPEWYVIKNRGDANNWAVYHQKSNASPEDYALYLGGTSAATDDTGLANDTAPTSTVFSLTDGNYGNQSSHTYIGYFFSEVQGYSKFGSYVGNGNNDGTFVYTGFAPAYVLIKKSSASGTSWVMFDNKRNTFNERSRILQTNDPGVEETSANRIDFTSNGFKLRGTWTVINNSGDTYIYMAFAEAPFVNSNGVPCNAR